MKTLYRVPRAQEHVRHVIYLFIRRMTRKTKTVRVIIVRRLYEFVRVILKAPRCLYIRVIARTYLA